MNIGFFIDFNCILILFNENLYVIGGEKYLYIVVKYSLIWNKLKKLFLMEVGRVGYCVVFFGDFIYMIIGFRD